MKNYLTYISFALALFAVIVLAFVNINALLFRDGQLAEAAPRTESQPLDSSPSEVEPSAMVARVSELELEKSEENWKSVLDKTLGVQIEYPDCKKLDCELKFTKGNALTEYSGILFFEIKNSDSDTIAAYELRYDSPRGKISAPYTPNYAKQDDAPCPWFADTETKCSFQSLALGDGAPVLFISNVANLNTILPYDQVYLFEQMKNRIQFFVPEKSYQPGETLLYSPAKLKIPLNANWYGFVATSKYKLTNAFESPYRSLPTPEVFDDVKITLINPVDRLWISFYPYSFWPGDFDYCGDFPTDQKQPHRLGGLVVCRSSVYPATHKFKVLEGMHDASYFYRKYLLKGGGWYETKFTTSFELLYEQYSKINF